MQLVMTDSRDKTLKWILYPILIITGIFIILLCSLIQQQSLPVRGEYYYSNFLRNNYTLLTNVFYFLAGFSGGYYFRLNPWFSGFCLLLVFPVTAIVEAGVYRGSHNLIPFELVAHFLMALPAVTAVYIGGFINRTVANKGRSNKNHSVS